MSTLLVIRHGQASIHAEDYDQLSTHGEAQARRLGAWLALEGVRLDAIHVGPLKRQRQTAEHLVAAARAAGLPLPDPEPADELDELPAFHIMSRAMPGLLESDRELQAIVEELGGLSTEPAHRLRMQKVFELVMLRWFTAELVVEEIETFAAFEARVQAGLDRITRKAGRKARVAAITSAGPTAVAVRRALGVDAARTLSLMNLVANSAIAEFHFREDAFMLSAFNATPHLARSEITLR